MKWIQGSFFRAICAVIVGALLIKYREETVRWITIAMGVLFFLSGLISVVIYYSSRKQTDDIQVYDANGKLLTGSRPAFPIVGLGSMILGIILAMMPTTFVTGLTYIFAAILILGAINQYVNLAGVTKFCKVGYFYWILPSVILLVGLIAIVKPSWIATAPLFIIGWCMVIYGVAELLNAIELHIARNHIEKTAKDDEQATPEGGAPTEEDPS